MVVESESDKQEATRAVEVRKERKEKQSTVG